MMDIDNVYTEKSGHSHLRPEEEKLCQGSKFRKPPTPTPIWDTSNIFSMVLISAGCQSVLWEPGWKPGWCPRTVVIVSTVEGRRCECKVDTDCTGIKKCCRNPENHGCLECMEPEGQSHGSVSANLNSIFP